MSKVSTYLNFSGNAEEAFNFYRSVFGGTFINGIMHMKDMPKSPTNPEVPDDEKDLILHIELPITGGHVLLGGDGPPSMGFDLEFGSNIQIVLEPNSRTETEMLFKGLSEGGKVTMPMQDMFWGAYYGSCIDKFGVQWMFSCSAK